jgi:predicted dehydrogenase
VNSIVAQGQSVIRVGVIGVGRGSRFARGAGDLVGMKLVALCDTWEEKLNSVASELGVTAYTDYDKFLQHDMDAVILANYFHEHAPFAIKALEAGKHVMSETSACLTLAQGVALIEAVERSGKIYMFAENYPYMVYNQEMRRLYQEGAIGEFRYGEGEYVHPMRSEESLRLAPGVNHWRNWIPATYYCTHSIAPVMYITDTWPKKVNGFVVPYDYQDENRQKTTRRSDTAAMIALRMDNGAVVKSLHGGLRGHGNWVRIHGNRGLMENARWGNQQMLRVRREPWEKPEGAPVEEIYLPDFPEHHEEALKAGHGGGDFFMNYHFANAIRTGQQPYLDVYRGVTMSAIGVLAYRSALADSAPIDVPDFRDPVARQAFANDHWSPNPAEAGPGQPLPSLLGEIKISDETLARASQVWAEMGYHEEQRA